ncbi:MAG TPA: tautomerase family protein [Gryllotalpicola sp.]
MPLITVDLPRALYDEKHEEISAGIHQAQIDALKIPADDKFQIFTPYDSEHAPTRFGTDRPGQIIVGVTMVHHHTIEEKQELYTQVMVQLGRLGIDPGDVHIPLAENNYHDWYAGSL